MDKRAEERRLKRRRARAASVYTTIISSGRDFTARPAISRAFRLRYVHSMGEATTTWFRANFGEPLAPRVKRHCFYDDGRGKLFIDRAWMVHPNVQGMHAGVWNDIMCAQASRDAMDLMHAKWLMSGGQS